MEPQPASGAGAGAAGAAHVDAATHAPPLQLQHTLAGHKRAVSGVAFSPNHDHLLASCSADASVALWDTRSAVAVTPASGMAHSQGINAVAWNPQGSYLASASDDLTARIWDAETGVCLRTLSGHTNYVFCCQFDPVAGHMLATGSFDETVRVWDVRSGRCLREIPAHSDPVTSLAFCHDATLLVSGSFDGLVRLWDASTGACLRTLAADRDSSPISFVTFSPNSKYLLQATLNSTLRLVNYETGKPAKRYTGHRATEYCATAAFLAPSAGGPLVASGSEDGALLVWHVNTKQVVFGVPGRRAPEAPGDGHCDAVLCSAAHERLPLLASGAHEKDATVKVWQVPHKEM